MPPEKAFQRINVTLFLLLIMTVLPKAVFAKGDVDVAIGAAYQSCTFYNPYFIKIIEAEPVQNRNFAFHSTIAVPLKEKLYLKTGLSISDQGQVYKYKPGNKAYYYDMKLLYVKIPLLLTYKPADWDKKELTYCLDFGPQLDWLGKDPEFPVFSPQPYPEIKEFGLDIVGQATLQYRLERILYLNIGIRVDRSIINPARQRGDVNFDGNYEDLKFYNMTAGIYAGLTFAIGQ